MKLLTSLMVLWIFPLILMGQAQYSVDGEPSVITNESRGGTSWQNPSNLTNSNGYADVTLSNTHEETDFLYAHDFGFNVAGNVDVVDVEVTLYYDAAQNNSLRFENIYMAYNNDLQYSNSPISAEHVPSDQYTFEDANDPIWGLGNIPNKDLTGDEVSDSTFGFALVVSKRGGGQDDQIEVDSMEVTLYTNDNPMPVELTTFDGKSEDDNVLLNWETASEDNSSHFVVERAQNDQNFSDIGRVRAAGESDQKRSYHYRDDNAPEGKNFYRLRMVDKDGTTETSEWIKVRHEKPQRNKANLYPNPLRSHDRLSFTTNSSQTSEATIYIINLNGRVVKEKDMVLEGHKSTHDLDLSDLQEGSYIFKKKVNNNFQKKEMLSIK